MATLSTPTASTTHQDDPWLTAKAVAAHLGLSLNTVYRDIRAGRMRAARVGGRREVRIRRSWADAALEATSTPVEATR